MYHHKLRMLFILSVLILSSFTTINTSANDYVLPVVNSDNSPIVDGNITRSEWNSSVSYETTLHGIDTTIYVVANDSHLNIGFNMSSDTFNSVNDTLSINSTIGFNNDTHDWFAIVIDNNLDKEFSSSSYGTSMSPDDVIVIDQYKSGAYDAFANGSSTQNFIPDNSSLTYSHTDANDTTFTTKINGSSGVQNVNSARNISLGQVYYEITKPLNSLDEQGYDFSIDALKIVQFKLLYFQDLQANNTLANSESNLDTSPWFALRLDDREFQNTVKPLNTTNINLIHNTNQISDIDALQTISELYDLNLDIHSSVINSSLTNYDLNIVALDENTVLTQNEIDILIQYIRNGGNTMILFGSSANSKSISEALEFEYLPNKVLINNNDSMIPINSLNSDMSFLNQQTVYTNQTVNSLTYETSAFNITSLLNSSNKHLLGQEFMLYDLFNNPNSIAYDLSNDGFVNTTENFESLNLGIAIDLLKGGRLSLIPSTSIIKDNVLTNQNNYQYLLKLIPWNSKVTNHIKIGDLNLDKRTLAEGERLSINLTILDAFNSSISDATVVLELLIGGNLINATEFVYNTNTQMYEGEFIINENGFINLEITAQKIGLGFAEAQSENIFVEANVGSFNDLSDLSIIIILIFIIASAALFLIVKRLQTIN